MDNNELKDLRRMLALANAQPERERFYSAYPLGNFWIENIQNTLSPIINSEESAAEKLQRIQQTSLYSVDTQDERIKELLVRRWSELFKKRRIDLATLDPRFKESPYCPKEKIFEMAGRPLSADFLLKLYLALEVERICSIPPAAPPSTFLELGGGFGNQARIMKLKYPAARYFILDIPETLYFSYIYLKFNFPDARIAFVTTKDAFQSEVAGRQFDFILVPCFLGEYLGFLGEKIDLALNTRSLGEMANAAANYYLKLLENKVDVARILLLNRFLNGFDSADKGFRLNENGCFAQLGKNWKILHWEFQPEFSVLKYGNQDPRELYFVGEKTKELEIDNLQDIYLEYWYTNFSLEADHLGSCELSFDKGCEGVLSRLVNGVRVGPNEKNLDALIKYIYLLEGKLPFEERYFYLNLYKSLTGAEHPILGQIRRHCAKNFIKRLLARCGLLDLFRKILGLFRGN